MLVDLYVEALLADEELAHQAWKSSDAGEITDAETAWAWCKVASNMS